jgi:hypothetical protein
MMMKAGRHKQGWKWNSESLSRYNLEHTSNRKTLKLLIQHTLINSKDSRYIKTEKLRAVYDKRW